MHLRPLGSTGLLVSPIGLGTVKLGRTAGLKHAGAGTPGKPPTLPTDDEALALLAAARDLGVNLIDTAPAYGTSEERLGALLPRVAPRDRWVICTKAGEEFDPIGGTDGRGGSRYDFSPATVRASVERSLTRLRTDRLDIALLHFAGSLGHDEPTLRDGAALGELQRLKAEGKVRAVGASTGTAAGAMLAAACCDVLMLTINREHTADLPAAALAGQRGVGVLVKKALGSGRLGATAADAKDAIRFACGQPGVSSVVIGATNARHLRDAAGAAAEAGS
ncbi:MAG: aldo/keto reductase [Phycisphaerales bacterium]